LNEDWVLEVETPTNWIYFLPNYLTRLEFKLDVDSKLSVL